ncbi:MAG: hypothetical protein AAGC73_00705 [Verrucomicrobiota bacterium]
MDLFHTTDTDGISILNPDLTAMRELIASLDTAGVNEADHPDVSLVHDPSGWSISLYPNGVAALENLDDEAEPRYLPKLTRSEALKLWVALSQGDLTHIRRHPWREEV